MNFLDELDDVLAKREEIERLQMELRSKLHDPRFLGQLIDMFPIAVRVDWRALARARRRW